jgi:hypothetical protein
MIVRKAFKFLSGQDVCKETEYFHVIDLNVRMSFLDSLLDTAVEP